MNGSTTSSGVLKKQLNVLLNDVGIQHNENWT